jgi:hypothetical protein
LQQYFKTLKHITDYHHFYIDTQQPGIVTCGENASSESFTFNLLKCKVKLHKEVYFKTKLLSKELTMLGSGICMSRKNSTATLIQQTTPKNEIDLTEETNQTVKTISFSTIATVVIEPKNVCLSFLIP